MFWKVLVSWVVCSVGDCHVRATSNGVYSVLSRSYNWTHSWLLYTCIQQVIASGITPAICTPYTRWNLQAGVFAKDFFSIATYFTTIDLSTILTFPTKATMLLCLMTLRISSGVWRIKVGGTCLMRRMAYSEMVKVEKMGRSRCRSVDCSMVRHCTKGIHDTTVAALICPAYVPCLRALPTCPAYVRCKSSTGPS